MEQQHQNVNFAQTGADAYAIPMGGHAAIASLDETAPLINPVTIVAGVIVVFLFLVALTTFVGISLSVAMVMSWIGSIGLVVAASMAMMAVAENSAERNSRTARFRAV